MTVEELIEKLQEIEDKKQTVYVYSYDDYRKPLDVYDHEEEILQGYAKGVLII